MDNLTHTLTAVLLARAGLRRVTPRATVLCVVAANIADIDIVSASSAINYLNYHRHLTHSLLAVPVMALLAALLVELPAPLLRKGAAPIRLGKAWLVAFAAALTHPLLDLTNVYGVRLWLPFSEEWTSWDVLFVVDAWVWGTLLLAVLIPTLLIWIHREIGARSDPRQSFAILGLLALGGFLGAKAVIHSRAAEMIDAHLYGGSPALRVAVFPTPWNPFVWQGFVETGEYYLVSTLDVRRSYDPAAGERIFKPSQRQAVDAAWESETGRQFGRFARYGFAIVDELPESYSVKLSDFRFRRGKDLGFLCTVELSCTYQILSQAFRF